MQPSILFEINPSSGLPVFKQLMDQVQRLIACGQLVEGDLLPSTRDVAKQLVINPMTVSKAYNLLELEGYLLRKKGVGMQVIQPKDPAMSDTTTLLRPALQELIKQSSQLGLSIQDVSKLLTEEWKKSNE